MNANYKNGFRGLPGACALAVSLLAAGGAWADISIWSKDYTNGDLALVDIEALSGGTAQSTWFRVGDDRTHFTLSADIDWTGKVGLIGPNSYNNNPIVFDFSSGNHTIKYGNNTYWPGTAHVTYKGGRWIVPSDFRLPGYGTTTGRTVIFDGSYFECGKNSGCYFWGANGPDNVIVFTNGAQMVGNSAAFFNNNGQQTRCNLMHVSTGSQITFNGADNDRGADGNDYGITSNKLVITGTGTYYKGAPLSAGQWSAGNTTIVSDHATVDTTYLSVGGYDGGGNVHQGDFARSNTMEIANATINALSHGFAVGAAAGGSYNTLIMRDTVYKGGNAYDADEVGIHGSHNEAYLENINFKNLFRITCGVYPEACYNQVTIKGATMVTNTSDAFRFDFFGQGQYNTFVLDNFSHNRTDVRANMTATENSGLVRVPTNNTLRIVNGSYFNVYDFKCVAACSHNTIEIQDAAFRSGHDVMIWGDSNTLILDNGTIYITQSGDNLDIGHPGGSVVSTKVDKDTYRDFVDGNNRFVIRGAHPKVVRTDESYWSAGKVYNGGAIIIELPAAGYDEADLPIFDKTGMTLYDTSYLQIKVPEALRKTLTSKTTYQLSASIAIDGAYVVPSGWTGSAWSYFLKRVNDALPAGCRAYGTNGGPFYIEIKPNNGLMLIIH